MIFWYLLSSSSFSGLPAFLSLGLEAAITSSILRIMDADSVADFIARCLTLKGSTTPFSYILAILPMEMSTPIKCPLGFSWAVLKKKTSAIYWSAYSEDQNPSVMRIDGFLRKNAGVSISDYVVVRKAEVKNAMSIVLAQKNYASIFMRNLYLILIIQ